MLVNLGFLLLFFLPVIESYNRTLGFTFLLVSSLLLILPFLTKKKIYLDSVDTLWLMVLAVFALSVLYSWSYARSYLELLRYIAYFLIFISIRNYPNPSRVFSRFYLPMVLVNSLILSFLSFLYYIPQLHIPRPLSGMNLFYPTFGYNRIAILLIFAIPLSFFLTTVINNKIRIMGWLISAFFVIALVFSMGRGAMLSLFLAFLLYLFIGKFKEKKLYGWTLVLAFITIIFLLSSVIYSNFLVSEKKGETAWKGFYKPIRYERRLDYFTQAIDGFRRFPVFGTGLDTFRYVSKIFQRDSSPYSWSWYAHNHYLEIFQEVGVLGGLLFTILVFIILAKSYKNISRETDNFYTGGVFIALLGSGIHSLIDYDWQYLSVFLLFWVGAAIILPRSESPRTKVHGFFSDNRGETPYRKSKNAPFIHGLNSGAFWYWGKNSYLPLSKNLRIPFFVIITILFACGILIPLDSDKVIKKALEYSQSGKQKEAIFHLTRAFRLDRMNIGIYWAFAEIFNKNYNDWDKVHQWYKRAILLHPMLSLNTIRKDYSLYLRQARLVLEENEIRNSYSYLRTAVLFYPFCHQKIEGDKYFASVNSLIAENKSKETSIVLASYLKLVQKETNKINLSPSDIEFTVKNICHNLFIDNKDKFGMLVICGGK